MDPMAEIRVTFFQECEEQLVALEAGLLTMEEGDTPAETVNAVFRAVHSVKGGAGAFKLETLVEFAHIFETALDKIRSGILRPDPDVMKLMLRAADVLADLVRDAREGRASELSTYGPVADDINSLLSAAEVESEGDDFNIDFTPVTVNIAGTPASSLCINFKPERGLFEKANEPIALLREIAELGSLEVECDTSAVPMLDGLDCGQSYLSWRAILTTDRPEKDVHEVFEFVEGDCHLSIERLAADEFLAAPADGGLGDVALANSPVTVAQDNLKPEASAKPSKGPAAPQPSIRVDLERVDRLINLVGELVINQAMLSQRVYQSGHISDAQVATSLDELEHLTRELQESVMAIRAQPVKPLFQRMSRIVREVADATGKQVRLRTEGDTTEVDKTVIELLADPLTHMIRNAVDHGLEQPQERVAAGKPPEGVVRLSAAHRSGRVVIEVADDGAGINRAKVLESAIRKGLVASDAQLSDSEIDNLLFLPGFSTASSVSNISGRGVGMDVVKRSIQALGGRIMTSSKPREGATFTMSLPLTLAVLDGIIVSTSDQTFVIPLTAIVETLKLEPGWLHSMGDDATVMQVRGQLVPLIDVGAELGFRPRHQKPAGGVAILVESEEGNRSALLVDGIQDQRQVVIKSLETNYGRAPGVAAATILGDGRVAMILDIDGLIGRRSGETGSPDWPEQHTPLAMAS